MRLITSSERERSVALFILVIAAIFWSLGGILIKLVNWNPIAIAGARSLISATVIWFFLGEPQINWSMPQLAAALAYVCTVMFFVSATKMTTAANAILLQFTAPIYVTLFSHWLLKEKTNIYDWLTVFVVTGGMGLFFLDNINIEGTIGVIIGIASGISFAFFTLFMRMQKDGSPLESVLMGNIMTAIIALPFMFKGRPDFSDWTYLIILGVFQLGIPYILYSKAIKHVSAIDAILVPVLEPLLNPVWVLLLLGETPGRWTLLGGIMVLVAITGRSFIPVLILRKKVISTNARK